jgi:uncharacterized repeat protein (TIGR03803 family)
MTKLVSWRQGCAVLVLCAMMAIVSPAQTFTTLIDFGGPGPTGLGPAHMSFVQGRDGSLYGTTEGGGLYNNGAVFKMTPAGVVKMIYSFCRQRFPCPDGAGPEGGLVLATDGDFYGTTSGGGTYDSFGTIFKITPSGTLRTLHIFDGTDGNGPISALIQGDDGNFYGTTSYAVHSLYGTIFRITPNGAFTTLYSFCPGSNCTSGYAPYSGLVQGVDGSFYGVTSAGGINQAGTVFKITRTGELTTLYNFCAQEHCTDGGAPMGGLILGADGNFYGTTQVGGTCNYWGCFDFFYPGGTVFKISPEGALTTVYSFCSQQQPCSDGTSPGASLIQGTDGNFYGTTVLGGNFTCNESYFNNGCGTVFKISPQGMLTTLHTFYFDDEFRAQLDATPYDGAYPSAALTQATGGTFFGVTDGGGIECGTFGCGTAFRLDMGLGPFVAFVRSSGKVGQTGGILGQGFTGTSGVSLNGTPADFTVVSDTFIKATVPPGATTGYVTVVTPSGTLTSNVPFRVLP